VGLKLKLKFGWCNAP